MPRSVPTVPPFLTGIALLFWGSMTDRLWIAVALALIVESARWTRLRWDFGDSAFIRAWQLSVILIGMTAALVWIEGNRYDALPQLIGWMPALMLPVQFVQIFGTSDTMPLTTFSFFARKRLERNQALGISPGLRHRIHFGHVYLALILLSSMLGVNATSPVFLAGLVALAGWALIARNRDRRVSILVTLVLAGFIALAGEKGLTTLYRWALQGGTEDGFDPGATYTSIGRLGHVKQSNEILWRLKTSEGPRISHLRTASYNTYVNGQWNFRPLVRNPNQPENFNDLKTIEPKPGEIYYLAAESFDQSAADPSLPRVSLRGTAKTNSLLPAPGNLASLTGFQLESVERNATATLRVAPKEAVLNGTMLWSFKQSPDDPPRPDAASSRTSSSGKNGNFDPDRQIPPDEAEAVKQVSTELGLASMTTLQEKLDAIRVHFARNFRYTRYLSIPSFDALPRQMAPRPTPLRDFLLHTKAGHCEYFATAATLLLRDARIPVRYTIGFAVMEYDKSREEYVIRGTHGHAWCRVWDEKRSMWIDFDPTPPDWLGIEMPRTPAYQGLLDWLTRTREDFFLWRTRAENQLLVGVIMSAIGLIGAAIVGRNLWRSRKRIDAASIRSSWQGPVVRTPLHELEPLARKRLGPRPPGLPFGRWLAGLKDLLDDPAPLEEAIALHQARRFDPVAPADETRLTNLAGELKRALRAVRRRSGKTGA